MVYFLVEHSELSGNRALGERVTHPFNTKNRKGTAYHDTARATSLGN